jgi:hypothetical protein
MRIDRLSDISADYFSVTTGEPISLVEFTRHIGLHASSFGMLSPRGARQIPAYEVCDSRISRIKLDGIFIEIAQVGCTQIPGQLPPLSTHFLVTGNNVRPARLELFKNYLAQSTNPNRMYGEYVWVI